ASEVPVSPTTSTPGVRSASEAELRGFGLGGKPDGENRPLALLRVHEQLAAVLLHEVAADRQPEARKARATRAEGRVEEGRELGGRDAAPGVSDAGHREFALASAADGDLATGTLFRTGVDDQIHECLGEPRAATHDHQ